MNAIPELQLRVDQLKNDGATILFTSLDPGAGCYGALAPCRATIMYEIGGTKVLWIGSGNINNGEFELAIGRQHPITDEQYKAYLADTSHGC